MGKTHQIPLPLDRPRPLTPRVRIPAPAELREWAKTHHLDVGAKGRLPESVELAYVEEQLGFDA